MTISARTASLGELSFASCYVYAPHGVCKEAQRLRTSVKKGEVDALLAEALRSDAAEEPSARLVRFFPAAAVLVPVPGSVPGCSPRTTPAGRLAIALLQKGLGQTVWFGLRRVKAVRKSATAPPGARPTVRVHYDTMAIDALEYPAAMPIILIDDVVSKGRTLRQDRMAAGGCAPHSLDRKSHVILV